MKCVGDNERRKRQIQFVFFIVDVPLSSSSLVFHSVLSTPIDFFISFHQTPRYLHCFVQINQRRKLC